MEHLAIILDGNRRYAKKHHETVQWGHMQGAKKAEELLSWMVEFKIPMLTVYALSLKNMKRPGASYLYEMLESNLDKALSDERISKHGIRFNVIGRRSILPPGVVKAIQQLEERTKHHTKFQVNLAIGYDGRAEIVDAIQAIAKQVKESKLEVSKIDEAVIERNLYLNRPPELIIRPGGEQRLSGFLLWGSSYSEFYFTPKLWPEFTKDDLVQALEEFDSRERRYGL